MRLPNCAAPLALVLALVASPATADMITEGAFAFASRVSTNTNFPNPPGPTYTLQTTSPGSGLSPLTTYADSRGTGYFADFILKFNLATIIPSGQSILAASLTYHVQMSQTSTPPGQIAAATASGFAADANAVSLADFSLSTTSLFTTTNLGNTGAVTPAPAPFTQDVTALVQSLQSSGATSVGIRFDPAGGGIYVSAPNDANVAFQPTLSITYTAAVPEPASIATLGLSLTIVGLIMKKGSGLFSRHNVTRCRTGN